MSVTMKKQPSEVMDYDVDMIDFFSALPNDYITSVAVTIDATGATPDVVLGPGSQPVYQLLGSPAKSFKIWTGGGVSGTKYKITAIATTFEGRLKETEFFVRVKDT